METLMELVSKLLGNSKKISKAIAAAATAAIAFYTAPEVVADSTVSGVEWLGLVATALGAGLITFFSPKNADG